MPRPSRPSLSLASAPDRPDPGTSDLRKRLPHVIDLIEGEDGRTLRRTRVQAEPLDRYLARGELLGRQAEAATRLRAQWTRCHYHPGLTMNWAERVGGSRLAEADRMSDGMMAARDSVRKAIRAVGIRLSDVLVQVICEGRAAKEWAISTGRHPASGFELFRVSLDALADHYGLPDNPLDSKK